MRFLLIVICLGWFAGRLMAETQPALFHGVNPYAFGDAIACGIGLLAGWLILAPLTSRS